MNVAEGEAQSGRSVSDIAVIRAVMTIVGDTDEERNNERELVRASMSCYVSTHLPRERRRNARMPEIVALP